MKRAIRILIVGLLAGAMVPVGPSAPAKYPPDLPFNTCLQRLNTDGERQGAYFRGERFRIAGRPGCGLSEDGTQRLTVRVILIFFDQSGERFTLRRNRLAAPNGQYSTTWRVPLVAREGLHRVTVRIRTDEISGFINVKTANNASASLPATKTTLPTALAVGILGLGMLFLFTPIGRRAPRLIRGGAR